MIAVDTNLLVYAHRRDSPWFEPARRALRLLIEGTATWAVPWPCVHEFLAISTHPKIYRPRLSCRAHWWRCGGGKDYSLPSPRLTKPCPEASSS